MFELITIGAGVMAAFVASFGIVRFWAWCGDRRLAYLDSKYRAEALIAESKREVARGLRHG